MLNRQFALLIGCSTLLVLSCGGGGSGSTSGSGGKGQSSGDGGNSGTEDAGNALGGSSADAGGTGDGGSAGSFGSGGMRVDAGFGGSTNSGGTPGSGGVRATGGASIGGSTGAGGVRDAGADMPTASDASAGGASGGTPYKGVANSACDDLMTLKASWFYNWTTSPGTCKTTEFIPMVSGKNEKTAAAVTSAVTAIANAGYKTLLAFNEPNKTDQANMTVAQVVVLWPQLTANAAIRVGSPVVSADAQAWFNDFMAQVATNNLRVDFVAVHWYGWNAGSCDNASELERHIVWAEQFKKPIWLTEFGCINLSAPTTQVVEAFYAAAVTMLAKHPLVERHAWYPWNTNNGLVATNALTPLGTIFSNAPAYK